MGKKMRSPLICYGGKGHIAARILEYMPPHHTYVEPFGGGASLLFAKAPSPVEVYNDIDSGLVTLFRVLRDEEKFKKFHFKVSLIPYSREEFLFCRDTWMDCEDEVEKAVRFYVRVRQCFNGFPRNSWSFSVTKTSNNMAKACSAWLSSIELLPEIHRRLMRVQIEHLDFRQVIALYDTPETLFYCDPPYVLSTRRQKAYTSEMSDQDHEDLVDILLRIKGMAMLSGYENEIYSRLEENGWKRLDFPVACFAVGRTRLTGLLGKGTVMRNQLRVECLWLSPKTVKRLELAKGALPILRAEDYTDDEQSVEVEEMADAPSFIAGGD